MNLKSLTVVALAIVAHAAHADTLLSADFESPAYSVGTIYNQQGWTNDTVDDGYTTVTNNRSFAGSNSLLLTSDDVDYSAAWKTFSYRASTSPASAKTLVMETQIWVDGSDETFAGLDVYSSTGSFGAGAYITGAGDLLVAGRDGASTSYELYTLTGAPVATLNGWNRLSVTLDFSGASTVYTVGLNGTSVDLADYDLHTAFTAATTIIEADAYIQNDGAAGTAYFDNMRVESVPEPASMAALGLGAAALLRRRKKA